MFFRTRFNFIAEQVGSRKLKIVLGWFTFFQIEQLSQDPFYHFHKSVEFFLQLCRKLVLNLILFTLNLFTLNLYYTLFLKGFLGGIGKCFLTLGSIIDRIRFVRLDKSLISACLS